MPFEIHNWLEMDSKLQKFPEALLEEVSEKGVQVTRNYLNKVIDWNRNRLVNSIRARSTGDYSKEISATGKPAFYEKFVHDGRGSFSAKNKKALHWVDRHGHDVFVPKPRKVKAFHGYHYYPKVAKQLESNLNAHVINALHRVGLE